ncbi:aminotransferase class I/II-fold pyridoxal phosphate-dependent enzyme [Demequina lignilytica]|uniref:Aminotransferase n=1 Tax=Demequina lignilytica TaxID=3051663 RepID=A0AB35MDV9_9MICO|nr:aminotransferase class I/II-fold pyridoxal phosphate-dependent enzyme [Demequina sp. SYSU T0a273]MDN4481947.1 aminotransferase class I/II-fold pyridoxal phosphate-dependent enzyme [Demequina sp. SYSU T0a273]
MELARRALSAQHEIASVLSLFEQIGRRAAVPGTLDFTFGNPHEPPLDGLVDAIRSQVEPRSDTWFAYTTSQQPARETVAAGLTTELGLEFEPGDVAMTQGAFGAISLAFHLLTDPGDEVVVPVPGWFCYPPMLRASALTPVPADLAHDTFDLDLDAIARAITPRTRIVVVNSPANPTGRVLPRDQLEALALLLDAESARIGRRIWILSDEPYRRIRFSGVPFVSPAAVYPWTLIDYSYGKILLAPGQRLGYLALSPLLPRGERDQIREAYDPVQLAIGWGFPDALMQYAVPALEDVGLDLVELESKRDRMHGALAEAGYTLTRPEGTFYLWGEAPRRDGDAFAASLAERGVLVMPGSLFDRPAQFRISLTATMPSIEAALPAFRELA